VVSRGRPLGMHHCKPVKAWLAEHKDEIEVFYLPSYSPELNPDERLNADLKHAISTKVPPRPHREVRGVKVFECRINKGSSLQLTHFGDKPPNRFNVACDPTSPQTLASNPRSRTRPAS
jgi:hypothetical protein